MAVTIAEQTPAVSVGSHGSLRVVHKLITFDNSYASSGELLLAAQVGLANIKFGAANILTPAAAGAVNVTVSQVTTAGLEDGVLLKANTATASVAGATDLSALVVAVTLFGEG